MKKGFLVFTLFNRFSYYLFLSFVTIYLHKIIDLSTDCSGDYYSGFSSIVYFSPIIFGFIADRFGYLRIFHFGIIFAIIGYIMLPLELIGTKHADIIVPLLILSLGLGSLNLIVPTLIGTYSQKVKDRKGYVKFVWYFFFISLGSFLSKTVTKDINASDFGESLSAIFIISAFFLIIGYLIWFLTNRFGKKLRNDELNSNEKKSQAKRFWLIRILIISFLLIFISYGLSFYLSKHIINEPGLLPNRWTSFADLILMLLFGFILMQTKSLFYYQLIQLVKLGAFILGIVVFISLIVAFVFQNGLNNTSSTILFIIFESATTLIWPLLMYLVFELAGEKHRGLIMGIYLALISLAIYSIGFINLLINKSKVFSLSLFLLIIGGVLFYIRDKQIKNIA